MPSFLKVLGYAGLAVLLAGSSYLFYREATPFFAVPCEKPLTYSIGAIDERFGVSRATVLSSLSRAALLWNEAAGKTVLVLAGEGAEGDVPVDLVYGEEQKTSELGSVIHAEQAAYDAQKAVLEGLRAEFNNARAAYEKRAASFDRAAAKYHEDVEYWNSQGGAPEAEYRELGKEQERLASEQETLQRLASALNESSDRINDEVDELNTLAKKLNAKVGTYNERAGEDFDQGHYQSDGRDARITIYQFEGTTDLARILAHELGHALGIDHVENPESIMYSYNIGASLALSDEDRAALRTACRLNN